MPPPFRILLADDDVATIVLLTRTLSSVVDDIETALDGDKARSLLAQNRYDLAILDVVMPGATGFSVIWRLRKAGLLQTPIWFLSSRDRPGDRLKGLRSGAENYITKPFDPREIRLRVERFLEEKTAKSRKKPSPKSQPRSFVTGCLGEIHPGDLVQLMHLTGRNALLEISSEGRTGFIRLWGGRVYDAEIVDQSLLAPEAAFYEICSWRDGEYHCHSQQSQPKQRMTKPTEALLIGILLRLPGHGG